MSDHLQRVVTANAGLYPDRLRPGFFRLLRLETPGMRCSFEVYAIDDVPEYHAVSYTWRSSENGSESESDNIKEHLTCPGDDVKSNETARPSKNCHEGIVGTDDQAEELLEVDGQQHRVSKNVADIVSWVNNYEHAENVERLWIDSLCINQADAVERSAQVSMMGEIYRKAMDVAVWLGWDDRGEMEMVMGICQIIQTEFRRLEEDCDDHNFRVRKIPNFFEPAVRAELGLHDVTDEAWLAFARFWDRRWFHRAWVVQEAALARELPRFFWHLSELDRDQLFDVSRFLMDAETGLGTGDATDAIIGQRMRPREWLVLGRRLGETLEKIRALRFLMEPGEPSMHDGFWRKCDTLAGPSRINGRDRTDCMRLWTHMLELFRAFDATDPRDHVYSTLGIIKATAANHGLDPPPVVVDYTRPVAEVYADAVKHIIEAGGCVNLLCLASDPQTRLEQSLPSWVPDFSAGYEIPMLMTNLTRRKVMARLHRLAQTHRTIGPCFEVHKDLKVLRVRAMPLDEIVAIGETRDELTNAGMWEKTAQILLSQSNFSPECPGESRIESLWRTLIANTSFDDDDIATSEMAADFKAFMTTSLVVNLQHDADHLDKLPSLKLLIEEEMRSTTSCDPNPAILTFDEALALAAEVDRRWTAIEAGGSLPEKTPTASGASRFGSAMEPMFYRRIILTRGGYLGIGPASTQPGDLVWVMPDAPLPMVLRAVERNQEKSEYIVKDRYKIFGEAYLHGDPDFRSGNHQWQWIELE